MTEEQYKRSNNIAYPIIIFIFSLVLLLLLAAVFQTGATFPVMIQIISILVCTAVATVFFVTKKGEKISMVMITFMGAVMYAVIMIFNSTEISFLYGLPILFACIAYLNKRVIFAGDSFILVFYVIHVIKMQLNGTLDGQVALVSGVVVVLCCIASYMAISLLHKYNDEIMEAITKKAKEQQESADIMREVAKNITSVFASSRDVINQLSEAIKTNDLSMKNIADSTENTANAIQEQATMCNEIQNNTDQAEQKTESMIQASDRAKATITEGAQIIAELKNQAEIVNVNNNITVQTTEKLSARVNEVNNILDAILSISSQTNLLALNASIEAARAGEAGKGFAVVADEIRTLSEDTRESANQITNIISELVKDVESTNSSVEESSKTIMKQSDMIDETKLKFETIETEVNDLIENIYNTEKIMKEIIHATGIINDNITHLSATSEEVVASSEEGVRMSEISIENLQAVNNSFTEIYELAKNLENA